MGAINVHFNLQQNETSSTARQLHLSWGGFVDPHSPIIYYRVCVGSVEGEQDVLTWQDVGMTTGMT